jgi:hypothetical protein
MRRRGMILGLCAALIGVGLVAGSLLPAVSQEPTTQTFRLCEKDNTGSEKFINVGKRGLSAGDWGVEVLPLFDPQSGRRVGRDVTKFTVAKRLGRRDALNIVEVTATLRGGKLTLYGTFKFSSFRDGVTVPITGGSGRYLNAGGSATAQPGRCDGARGTRIVLNVVR